MQINEFLNDVCKQIRYKPIRNEIAKELEGHITDLKENYIEKGIDEKEAEKEAILQMGNAEEIGKKLNKIHKPKFNWILCILVLILLGFGVLVNNLNHVNGYATTIIFSMIPFIIIYFYDYKKLIKYCNFLYAIPTIILLYTKINKFRSNIYYID